MRTRPETLAAQTALCLLLFLCAFFSISERALAASQGLIGYAITGLVLPSAYGAAIIFLKRFRNYTSDTLPVSRRRESAYMGKTGRMPRKASQKTLRQETQQMYATRMTAERTQDFSPPSEPISFSMDAPLPPPHVTQGLRVSEHTRRLGVEMEHTVRMPELHTRPKTEEERRREERAARQARAQQRAAARQAGQERLRQAVDPAISRAETVTRRAVGSLQGLPPVVQLRMRGFSRYYWTLILCADVTAMLGAFVVQLLLLKCFGRASAVGIAGYSVLPRYQIPVSVRLLVLVLLPAVLQELFLRGALFSLFEQFGTSAAVFCSALAGACLSRSPQTAAAMFAAGLILGILTYWTRSIFPAVLGHGMIRLYALWVSGIRAQVSIALWQYFVAGNIILLLLFAYLTVRTAYNRAREGLLPVSLPGMTYTGIHECFERCGLSLLLVIFAIRTLGQLIGLFYW